MSKLSAGQASLQFDGRRKGRAQRHCGQEAARISGGGVAAAWGREGVVTPTGVKEEGSVWKRKEEKKHSKPHKASEKQYQDCRRRG